MPRLPTLDDLGARPTPVSRRSVASNPRAGAVGDALAGFGGQLQQAGGKMLAEQREREDRLDYAKARSALLRTDIEVRKELDSDPDYDTWEARYTARMSAAQGEAAKLIRSSADRVLFEQEAGVDVLRGAAELARGAFARRVDAEVSGVREQLFGLQDLAQDAVDDASREAVIANASELIGGLQAKGYISAEAAGNLRREWTQGYAVQRIETMIAAGDLEGAQSFFEANQGRLDAASEISLGSRISGALDDRDTLIEAEFAVHRGSTPVAGEAPSLRVSGWASPVVTELQKAGYRAEVVAGFLGNFEVEGGFAGALGDDGTASGLAQWRAERRANFRQMFGKDPSKATLEEQAQFVVWEMQNPQAAGMTVAQRDAILAARTPGEAAALIDRHYERSSGAHRTRRQEAAQRYFGGTSQSPQQHDLNNVYAFIDQRAEELGWAPEKEEAVKAQAARLVDRDEALLNRQYAAAADEAAQAIAALPNGLTDISQIPADVRSRMDPTDLAELQQGIRERARERREQEREAAQEARAAELEYMKRFLPEEYLRLDPLRESRRLSPEQYNGFLMDWTEAKQGKPTPQSDIQAGIRNEIAFQQRASGIELSKDEQVRLSVGMEAQLGLIRERKGKGWFVTAADYGDAYRSMVKSLPGTGGFFGRDMQVFEALEVPAAEAERIRRAWTGTKPPTDAEILQTWMELRR